MTPLDWTLVAGLCLVSLAVGLVFTRRAGTQGASGYFTGNRSLPWWAIGLSNTATYQSGNGGFVMLVLVFGIAGNWLWWASWIFWMPLVAIVWARMWRRMGIVTTAELITLRYHGAMARHARRVYALVMFCFSILIMAYITGFFAKTVAPLVHLSETQILLIFGTIALIYTVMGGLVGVVYVDVIQFVILMVGSVAFFCLAIPQHGGWAAILDRVAEVRPEGLKQIPPVEGLGMLALLMLMLQGLFFAGSPTAGEGMTAQRFMAAKNERHAVGGQLFNAFLALSFRAIPLIGLGIIAMTLFWTEGLTESVGEAPAGMKMLDDPAHAWGELVKATRLPAGLVGVLVAAEVAALMSTMSSLINWGSSFIVNDFYKDLHRGGETPKHEVLVSRIATIVLFLIAAGVSIAFVDNMVNWFVFINSAMVVFLLPLAWFRFFWWRFNVYGELAATILGLPLSILIWFVLDFQSKPLHQGIGMLFFSSLVFLIVVTLLTPAEPKETLRRFYDRCRPYGLWSPVTNRPDWSPKGRPGLGSLLTDAALGILACLGLVLATNAAFVGDWPVVAGALVLAGGCGWWLLHRTFTGQFDEAPAQPPPAPTEP